MHRSSAVFAVAAAHNGGWSCFWRGGKLPSGNGPLKVPNQPRTQDPVFFKIGVLVFVMGLRHIGDPKRSHCVVYLLAHVTKFQEEKILLSGVFTNGSLGRSLMAPVARSAVPSATQCNCSFFLCVPRP